MQSLERLPGRRGRSRTTGIDDVVVRERAVAPHALQKLYRPPIPSRITSSGRGFGGSTLARTVRIELAMGMQESNRQMEKGVSVSAV